MRKPRSSNQALLRTGGGPLIYNSGLADPGFSFTVGLHQPGSARLVLGWENMPDSEALQINTLQNLREDLQKKHVAIGGFFHDLLRLIVGCVHLRNSE